MRTIEFINDDEVVIDGITFKKTLAGKTDGGNFKEMPSPFKKGDWLVNTDRGAICATHPAGEGYDGWVNNAYPDWDKLFKLVKAKPIKKQPDAHICSQEERIFIFSNPSFRLATPKEIGDHLKTVAKERGFVSGGRFESTFSDGGSVRLIAHEPGFDYYMSEDRLHVDADKSDWRSNGGNGCSNPIIYKNGKWAEIIHSKLALPKTKKEFAEFLNAFFSIYWEDKAATTFMDKFLNQYGF